MNVLLICSSFKADRSLERLKKFLAKLKFWLYFEFTIV